MKMIHNRYSNSRMLAPGRRSPGEARLAGRGLAGKSAAWLRRDGWCAGRFTLHVRPMGRADWSGSHSNRVLQDTGAFLAAYEQLWAEMTAARRPQAILWLAVCPGELVRPEHCPGDLLSGSASELPHRDAVIAHLLDSLNRRYGRRIIRRGVNPEYPGFFDQG